MHLHARLNLVGHPIPERCRYTPGAFPPPPAPEPREWHATGAGDRYSAMDRDSLLAHVRALWTALVASEAMCGELSSHAKQQAAVIREMSGRLILSEMETKR